MLCVACHDRACVCAVCVSRVMPAVIFCVVCIVGCVMPVACHVRGVYVVIAVC